MIMFTDGGSLLNSPAGLGSGTVRSIVVQSPRRETWLKVPRQGYLDVRASPDGQRLALTIRDSLTNREDIWLYFFATDQLKRLTRDGMNSDPVWTADGKRIVWRVTNPGATPEQRYFSMPWDESAPPTPVPGADNAVHLELPPLGGKYLAYVRGDDSPGVGTTNTDIYIAPIDSPAAARPFASSAMRERMPRFSPDGKWLAYVGHELGTSAGSITVGPPKLFVRPVPGPGSLTQVSLNSGNTPLWSKDGRTLYYFSGGGPAPLVAAHISFANGFDVTSRSDVITRDAPGTQFAAPIARTSTDILPTGEVVYLTVVERQSSAPSTPVALTIAPSQVVAIVNWLGTPGSTPRR